VSALKCVTGVSERRQSHVMPVVCIVGGDLEERDRSEKLIRASGWQPRTFGSAEELLADPGIPCPRCALVNYELPGLSGLELQGRLTDRPEISIIFVSAYLDVEITVRAMKAGAVDCLLTPVAPRRLLNAIVEGLERSRDRLAKKEELSTLRARYDSLTARQREVMDLVISGRLNKQVADQLGISEITVKAHRGRVMRKMRVASLADLVRAGERLHDAALRSLYEVRVHGRGSVIGVAAPSFPG
jgi:FixJ family two-component response regulator